MSNTSGVSGTNNPYGKPDYGSVGKESTETNPYEKKIYSHASTEYNTLTIADYFKLLAAQLANQDMNNPMSNSEMMAQMVQMAMVQSMTSMNDVMENMISTMENSQIISTQTYAAGLTGQEVTVSVTEQDEETGETKITGSKTGVVSSVNFTTATPTFRLEGDDTDYPLTHLLGMGKVKAEIPQSGEGDQAGTGQTGGENQKIA